MDALAHKDSLTGVGSKLAYDQKVKQLSEDIANGSAEQVVEQVSLLDFAAIPTEKNMKSTKRGSADREKQEKLEGLMDELRKKHGEGGITLGYQENEEIGLTRSCDA